VSHVQIVGPIADPYAHHEVSALRTNQEGRRIAGPCLRGGSAGRAEPPAAPQGRRSWGSSYGPHGELLGRFDEEAQRRGRRATLGKYRKKSVGEQRDGGSEGAVLRAEGGSRAVRQFRIGLG
jgi:hypothetical protein